MSATASFDPALVLSAILRRNAALMNTAHGFVALINPGDDCLTIEYGMGLAENYVGTQVCEHEGVAWYVYSTREPQIVSHYREWKDQFRGLLARNQNQVGTVVGTPAIVNGAVQAVLVFIFEADDVSDEHDLMAWLVQVGESASSVLAQLEREPNEPEAGFVSATTPPFFPTSLTPRI